jgi:hypothetical protein
MPRSLAKEVKEISQQWQCSQAQERGKRMKGTGTEKERKRRAIERAEDELMRSRATNLHSRVLMLTRLTTLSTTELKIFIKTQTEWQAKDS